MTGAGSLLLLPPQWERSITKDSDEMVRLVFMKVFIELLVGRCWLLASRFGNLLTSSIDKEAKMFHAKSQRHISVLFALLAPLRENVLFFHKMLLRHLLLL